MKTTFLIVTSVLLACCAGQQQSGRDENAEAAELHWYEADFRPSDHDPGQAPLHGGTPAHGIKTDSGAVRDSAGSAEDDEIQGFRVQIFSTTNIDAAKAKQTEAESYFPEEWFYMQYDPPTYKIRAGNFRQRFEADRFVRLAAEKGFTDAWVVPEKVFKSPPAPHR